MNCCPRKSFKTYGRSRDQRVHTFHSPGAHCFAFHPCFIRVTVETQKHATLHFTVIIIIITIIIFFFFNQTPYTYTHTHTQTMAEFLLYDASTWEWWQYVAWVAVVLLGLEIMAWLTMQLKGFFKTIPAGGKPLEKLSNLDKAFITFNRTSTALLTYHVIRYTWYASNVKWQLEEISFLNTFVSLAGLYLVYDFFYVFFHWALHIQALYPWVHKHHHRQVVPFRGNTDAVNVHPFEFVVGEYLHLLAIYLLPSSHIITVFVFIVLGGVLASLNHTRFDVDLDPIYLVKAHDVHHRLPRSNYGQYTMFWDRVIGSYRPFATKITFVEKPE